MGCPYCENDYDQHESEEYILHQQLKASNELAQALIKSLAVAEQVAVWRLAAEAHEQAEFNEEEEARRVAHFDEQKKAEAERRAWAAKRAGQAYVPQQYEEYKPTYRGESRY